jgi:hypothetical protein
MKWMLVVLVFGTPMETGLLYGSLDECLKAEATMRADWERVYGAMPKRYQEHAVVGQDYIKKQMTSGTCIPHAEGGHALSHSD